MKTIRAGVFETNSSSTHAFTTTHKAYEVVELPLRNKRSLPKLNKDGDLEIEMDRFWECGQELSELEEKLGDPYVILQYLAAQCLWSHIETLYSRRNHEWIDHSKENFEEFEKDVKEAYKILGRRPPKNIKIFTLLQDGTKMFFTPDNLEEYHLGYNPDSYWYSSKEEWEKELKKRIKARPKEKDWPITMHMIGLAENDLLGRSYRYETSFGRYIPWNLRKDQQEELEKEVSELTPVDMITRDVKLLFYHT